MNPFDNAEVISRYSRAQAIEDGVLVDVTNATDKDGGRLNPFKFPVALTRAAYEETVATGGEWRPAADGSEDEELQLPGCQDAGGRLWDVLHLCVCAGKRAGRSDRAHFQVSVLVDGVRKRKTVRLWSLCGPGDQGEPVITIMLEGED